MQLLQADAAIARYLYVKLENELYYGAGNKGKAEGYSGAQITRFRLSYIAAATDIICDRLQKQKEELKNEDKRYGALIVLKEGMIRDYIGATYPRLTRSRFHMGNNGTGTAAGRAHGERADLGMNKIHGSSSSPKYLS